MKFKPLQIKPNGNAKALQDDPVIDDNQGIEVDIVPDNNQEVEPLPPLLQETANEVATAPTKVETTTPVEIPGVRRSTRVKFQTKQAYIPSKYQLAPNMPL